MLSTWPKYLQLELVVDSEISTLDIQAWIRQTKAPLVRLGYTDGTDKSYFDNLVETLRNARGVSSVCPAERAESMTRTPCPRLRPRRLSLSLTLALISTQL